MRDCWGKPHRLTTPTALAIPLIAVALLIGGCSSSKGAWDETPGAQAGCHPSYDPCLDPNAYDYDCEGGSGDGPNYTGQVTVTGSDDYDLDSDGDGTGCEPY